MAEAQDFLKGMSMMDKVSRFFVLIGEESTVKIFQHLPKEMVEEISTSITQISAVNKDVSLAILEEFHLYTRSKSFISSGGYDFARDILYKSLGKGEADEVLAKLSRMKLASQSFAYLDAINPKQLSDFITHEHPQTIALIVAHLNTEKKVDVLRKLPEGLQAEVVLRVANLDFVSPELIAQLDDVLKTELSTLGSIDTNQLGGVN